METNNEIFGQTSYRIVRFHAMRDRTIPANMKMSKRCGSG